MIILKIITRFFVSLVILSWINITEQSLTKNRKVNKFKVIAHDIHVVTAHKIIYYQIFFVFFDWETCWLSNWYTM